MRLQVVVAGAAFVALAACSTTAPAPEAAAPAAAAAAAKPTGYLSADALHGTAILPPPPAAGSPRDNADRAAYEDTRALKDTQRWAEAIQDNDLWTGGAIRRVSCTLGVDISDKTTPATLKVLKRIELDGRTIGTPPKDHFDRKRPALGNDKPICVPRADWLKTNASYPSGHTMVQWSWALILTELLPAKADAALRLGREMGESRVVCGVHFPSDVEAGMTLGAAMVARMHAEPQFQSDMAAARAELAGPLPAPTGCS